MQKTYGALHYSKEKKQWIMTAAQPHVCIKLKACFNKIPKTSTVPFYFEHNNETCADLKWFLSRYPMEISEADLKLIKRGHGNFVDTVNGLEQILLPDYTPDDTDLYDQLLITPRPYQIKARILLQKVYRYLLGDDLGLGKTVSAILGMFNKGGLPAVVVCQAHLTEHWEYQIAKCTRLTTHVVKTRTPYKLPKDIDVYIFTYSKTIGWVDLYSSGFFRYAIFDEVQELRTGYVSQKYCACKKLSDAAKYALGLSATPIYIDASNIYNILHLLKSHCMGSFEDFCREWAGASYRTVIQDTKALGSYLRDSFLFLRRTREDVGMEMPKVNVVPHLIEYDEKAVEAEEELLHQLAITITTGNFMERGQASRDFDLRMRQITGVSKAKYVANYVKIILDSGEPVLLFGWHREVYEIWEKEFAAYNPCFYTGTESPSKKNASKADFIEGRTNLMIMSLRSGIGVDGLQKRCSWVVFGELDWSPQVHKQDIGRIDRDGQEHPVTAVYLVSNGGSDPVLVDLLGVRASLSHNIIDPFSAVPEQHSDDSRIRMMAEHVLNKHKKRKEDLKAVDKIIADIPDEEIQND